MLLQDLASAEQQVDVDRVLWGYTSQHVLAFHEDNVN